MRMSLESIHECISHPHAYKRMDAHCCNGTKIAAGGAFPGRSCPSEKCGEGTIKISAEVAYSSENQAFQELLIQQLIEEVSELAARGLYRRYVRTDDMLSNPRGRIDLQRIAKQNGVNQATLPCTYYPRLEDCLINQVLLQGLHLAAHLTDDSRLRIKL
jgi:hypothetical protein